MDQIACGTDIYYLHPVRISMGSTNDGKIMDTKRRKLVHSKNVKIQFVTARSIYGICLFETTIPITQFIKECLEFNLEKRKQIVEHYKI